MNSELPWHTSSISKPSKLSFKIIFSLLSGNPIVLQHPASQTIDALQTAEFTAEFENVAQILWYKNNAETPISSSSNKSTLQIFRVQAGDEGYYHAAGIAPNGDEIVTNQAILLINSKIESQLKSKHKIRPIILINRLLWHHGHRTDGHCYVSC